MFLFRNPIVQNSLLLGIVSIFCLICSEIALRKLRPGPGTDRFDNFIILPEAELGIFDPELGWTLRPGVADNDERGYRSNNNPELKFKSNNRVLAIGDSYTFGADLIKRYSWPSFLERELKIRVINGGVGGYGLGQMLVRIRKTLEWARPQTVIVAPISDDFLRTELKRRHGFNQPYFQLDQIGNLDLVRAEPAPRPDPAKRYLGYFYSVHLLMVTLFPDYWLAGSFYDYRTANIDLVAVSKKIVDAIREETVVKRKIDLVFVLLPNSVFDDWAVRPNPDHPRIFAIGEYIRSVAARDERVSVVDLQTGFRIAYPRNEVRVKLFQNKTRGHYTAIGNQYVARALATGFNADGRWSYRGADFIGARFWNP